MPSWFAHGADEEYISWWGSKMSVCSVDSLTLQPLACEDYDPRSWKECEWSKGFEGAGAAAGAASSRGFGIWTVCV